MSRGFLNIDSARLGTVNNVAVATTSTAVASSAFGSQTYQIRICSTTVSFYKVDTAPTATASDAMLPPNWVEFVTVSPGQKISFFSPAIQTVSVVEVTQ